MGYSTYRSDIDGLRAIAVLSVLFFHLDSSILPGGFLGVDIFFVISGFLITRIIYTQKLDGQFTLTNFYSKRIKRILPPIFFLLFIVYVLGYIIMLPYDFYKVCISIVSVLFFSSNVQYSFRTNDYFSGDSAEWPLLHTWSLSVEEQYYLLFPFLIFLFLRSGKKKLFLILFFISLLSFFLAQYLSLSKTYKSISYYLLFTRMGELLIGSLLAISSISLGLNYFKSNFLALSSLFIIFLLFFLIDENVTFPGFTALLLCIPVAIIINSKDTIVNRILSNKLLVYIGILSYSLYLFHWPILAFYRYLFNFGYEEYSIPVLDGIILLLVIFIVSVFSYYGVEKPFRYKNISFKQSFLFYFILPTSLFLLVSSSTIYLNGLPSRLEKQEYGSSIYSHIDKNVCPSLININCKASVDVGSKEVIIYGNSHAEHYFKYISKISDEFGFNASLFASGGCGLLNASSKCLLVKKQFYIEKDQADIIIIAFRWDSIYKDLAALLELRRLLTELKIVNNNIIVLAQPPSLNIDPKKINNCKRLGLNCDYDLVVNPFYPEYNETIKKLVVDLDLVFFDPFQYIDLESFYSDINNFSDKDHLSLYGNETIFNDTKLINLFHEVN
ncbi:acyltransferase family protein [Shewanella sp.]|uniref:acyltransferase family protein n=1 Tax=Shewanella sp. TaxID=50422 RepID=UPI0040482A6A